MNTDKGAAQFDPSFGRDAELQEIATSDLSVEELMAGGADVDALIEAGVVDDEEDKEDMFYGEVDPDAFKYAGGPPMTEERYEAVQAMLRWLTDRRYLTEDAPSLPL